MPHHKSRGIAQRSTDKQQSRFDAWSNRAAAGAQVIAVIFVIFGYFDTVRPVYQKERLEEQVAKLEVDRQNLLDNNKNVLQNVFAKRVALYFENINLQKVNMTIFYQNYDNGPKLEAAMGMSLGNLDTKIQQALKEAANDASLEEGSSGSSISLSHDFYIRFKEREKYIRLDGLDYERWNAAYSNQLSKAKIDTSACQGAYLWGISKGWTKKQTGEYKKSGHSDQIFDELYPICEKNAVFDVQKRFNEAWIRLTLRYANWSSEIVGSVFQKFNATPFPEDLTDPPRYPGPWVPTVEERLSIKSLP